MSNAIAEMQEERAAMATKIESAERELTESVQPNTNEWHLLNRQRQALMMLKDVLIERICLARQPQGHMAGPIG
ncbi:MAG: hypothetical protein FWB90_03920 [Fibromonadales bacterium]|nr:hypothetical protein [Fibromonadales bacterium]